MAKKDSAAFRGSAIWRAVLLLLVGLPHLAQTPAGTSRLVVPVIHIGSDADLGLAFSNPTLESATITLTARSYNGEPITGEGITNPATVTLPPQGQRPFRSVDVFGPGIAGRAGWIESAASNVAVKGFFLVFDANLQYIDGAALASTPVSKIVFPKVGPETTVAFVNTGSQPVARASLTLYDNGGAVIERRLLPLPPRSGYSGPISGLLAVPERFSGYAVLDTAGTPFSSSQDVLAGTEFYRNRADVAALNAPSPDDLFRTGYLPYFVTGGGYYSTVGLVNPTRQAQKVRIAAENVDGRAAPQTVERTIPALGRLEEQVADMFGFSGTAAITGFIRYEVPDSSSAGLTGYIEYGTADGLLLAAAPAQGIGFTDILFSQIAESATFYTGLALLNPNAQAASVTIDAFGRDGKRIASAGARLEPGTRRTALLSELLPVLSNQSDGYVHVTASRPIFAFELFGSRVSPSILANVSAEGVQLRPQASGRPVAAARGASVLASDGTSSLVVPPGALASDTSIRVEPMPPGGLPDPSPSQRVIAAVDLRPEGTTFKIPLKLTIGLAADLTPGLTLPLLLYDAATGQYRATGFVVTVDESGRTASGDITHFSTYAAAVPDTQVLSVSGMAPSSGRAGTSVAIGGSGFSAVAGENLVTFAGLDNRAVRAPIGAATASNLTVTVPAGAVTGYVTVRAGSKSSIGRVFTVPEDFPRPAIATLAPSSVLVGTTSTDLEIAGTGFRPQSSLTYDGAALPVTFVDSTLLLTTVDSARLKSGIHRIAAANPGPAGGLSNPVEFTVAQPQPRLREITPAVLDTGDSIDATLTGSGFSEDSAVIVGGKIFRPSAVSPARMTVRLSNLPGGSLTVTVTNPSPGGGVSNGLVLFVRETVRPSAILVGDPVSGQVTGEIVVNEGNTVRPQIVVIDSEGKLRDDFPISLFSINPEIAAVDAAGNITGRKAGFSTMTVSTGGVLSLFTVTVVQVEAGAPGFQVTGVVQDFARHLYLAAAQDHTILLAQDLKQEPAVYAGVRLTPGLKNDVRLQSWFRKPSFLTLSQADGRLYVTDSANHVIRRIRPGASGAVETLAGTGAAGGTDGALASATFSEPQGIALDNRGYLWIADSGNHAIRRINLVSGMVETVAGLAGSAGSADGSGTSARFRSPMGLAIEIEPAVQQLARERRGDPPPAVRVIVADQGNGAIRRVSETGLVETLQTASASSTAVSKSTAAARAMKGAFGLTDAARAIRFNGPTGVAVDPLGNIFVTESGSNTVKTILTNGDVVSATQPNTVRSPQGLAINQTGRLVVASGSATAQEIRFGEPQIAGVSPGRIRHGVRETVTIAGNNFAPDTAVVIGGVLVSGVIIENTQRLSFTAPAAPSGLTTLSVQNRGGLAQTSLIVEPVGAGALAAGSITTIAGGSTYAGDGARAGGATIAPPWGVAVTSSGDLIISETALHRIRRVSATTNLITTVAGTGQSGFSGDGSPALTAALNNPVGVAADSAGNIYFADTSNDRIRKVSAATGLISTVAGNGLKGFAGDNGLAVNASLWEPIGIAVDGDGNLFVADTANNRVRKIAAATGIITTVVSGLNFPYGVAVDVAGNVYVADTYNFRIRKVAAGTGVVSTVAGNGVRGFGGDNGPATAASLDYAYGVHVDAAGNIYVSDTTNYRIRRIDAATNVITTIAGNGQRGFAGDDGPATSARLADPVTLSIDAAGNIFIVDTFNYRVRKIAAATGTISTMAGNGQQSLAGDNGPATLAALTLPSGIAIDAAGNILIADTYNHQIRKIAAATGIITKLAGIGSSGSSGDGGAADAALLASPEGVAVDASGNVYIADTANNRIRKIAAGSGTISTIAGAGLTGPSGMAVDTAGNLYFADRLSDRIRKIAAGTGVMTTVAGTGARGFSGDGGNATAASLAKPASVAVDADGNLYIADTANYRIRKVTASTGAITTVAGTGARGFSGDGGPAVNATLDEPYGVALDLSGNLLIADSYNNRIRRLNPATGIITTIVGGGAALGDNGPALSARLNNPRAVAVDSSGNLVIADWFNGRIRLVRAPIR